MRTDAVILRAAAGGLVFPSRPTLYEVTGARQTGKTTLTRMQLPELAYLTMDDPLDRERVSATAVADWSREIGDAIFDEAHKEPRLFDSLKAAFDRGSIRRSVLLGSAQIVMLRHIRESLAGRATLLELYPLMACELAAEGPLRPPLLSTLLATEGRADDLVPAAPPAPPRAREAIQHLLLWGGLPALLSLNDVFRRQWLADYDTSYLERDLSDLGSMPDLTPFRHCQTLTMARSAQLLNYSELAREAGIPVTTARRYIEYLQVSYQAFLLPPFARNLTSQVVKAPKVYAIDVGLLRQQTGFWGPETGPLFETLVASEMWKWTRTVARPQARLSFYRTRTQLEVDVLLTTDAGTWTIEVKKAARLGSADWRALADVGAALGDEWRGGLVVYTGVERVRLAPQIWAVPVHDFLA